MDEAHPGRVVANHTRADGGTGRKPGAQRARFGKHIEADLSNKCYLGDWSSEEYEVVENGSVSGE